MDLITAQNIIANHKIITDLRSKKLVLLKKLEIVNEKSKKEWKVDLCLRKDDYGYNNLTYKCTIPSEYIKTELIGEIERINREIISLGEMP